MGALAPMKNSGAALAAAPETGVMTSEASMCHE